MLLDVLRARGPAHSASLAWHPLIREQYQAAVRRFDGRADLEALVETGEVAAHTDDVDGDPSTVAYDVGVNRPEWDARFDRAKDVVREHCRRQSR